LIRALNHTVDEEEANVVISTAHKAKGREWRSVKLLEDFVRPDSPQKFDPSEMRLLYVACYACKGGTRRGGGGPLIHQCEGRGRQMSLTMNEPTSNLEAVAFHEAGHAVIALALGIPVGRVSIERNGSHLGVTELYHSDYRHRWKARGRIRPEHYAIDARAMVLMAGAIAEQHFLFDECGGDGSDIAEVEQLIPNDPEGRRKARLDQATWMLVARHADRIKLLASALREHRTLAPGVADLLVGF
jgi:hypothetical protein